MNLKDFERAMEYRRSDREYLILIEKNLGKNLDKIGKFSKAILTFLRLWGIRTIPNPDNNKNDKKLKKFETLERNLTKKLGKLKGDFKKLINIKLIKCKFNKDQEDTISKIYNQLKGNGLGSTAIAKIMHLILPDLFVMWDKKIKDDYRDHYLSRKRIADDRMYVSFLKTMQKEAEDLITQYKKGKPWKSLSDCKVQEKIEKEYGKKLTRLIDEYNWQTITRKKHNETWDRIENMKI